MLELIRAELEERSAAQVSWQQQLWQQLPSWGLAAPVAAQFTRHFAQFTRHFADVKGQSSGPVNLQCAAVKPMRYAVTQLCTAKDPAGSLLLGISSWDCSGCAKEL